MAKVNKKELVKNIKALNKKKLTDKVDVKGDVEDLTEDFISAIEDIDDNNKIDDVPESVIDFYEGLIEEDEDDDDKADKKSKGKKGKGKKGKASKDEEDDDDDDDDEDEDEDDDDDESESDLAEELEEMSLKELKAYVKDNNIEVDGKITKKTRSTVIEQILSAGADEDEEDDDDDDDDEDVDLSELSLKELKALAKEKGIKVKVTKKTREAVEEALEEMMEGGSDDDDDDDDDDDEDEFDLDEADVDEIIEYCDENGIKLSTKQKKYKVKKLRKIVAKKMDAGEKKTGKVGKSSGKGAEREIPKGLRKNTLPSEIFLAIKKAGDKGAKMTDLAQIVADAKNKGKKKKEQKAPLSFFGFVQRTVARKIAAAEGISVVQKHANSGNEGDAIFVLE